MLCSALGSAAALAADWQGEEVQRDGVLTIVNPENPSGGAVEIELEELWRVGGDDEDVLFGVIAQLVVDDAGDVYLLDGQLSEVQVFSRDGEWLRTLGREGEGPGEFRNGSDLYRGPDGNLGVVQIFPGRIVRLTPDGDPAGNFPLPEVEGGGFQLVHQVRGTRDHVVIAFAQQRVIDGKQTTVSMLRSFDNKGKELARFHEESQHSQFGGMKFEEKLFANYERRWAAAPDGRVAVAIDFDAYRIHLFNADGSVQRIIERPGWQPLERTGEERKRFQKFFDGITSWNPGSTFKISETHPSVSQIEFRDDGSMWVLSSRGRFGLPDGIFASWDVFDDQGHFVQRVHLRAAGLDPVDDGLFFVKDRVYVVTDLFSAIMANLGGDDEDAAVEAAPVSVISFQIDAPTLVRH
jgi:hypothetical protein